MSNRVRTADEQARYIDSIQPAPGIGGNMKDRPLAIDVRYPPDSVEGFRPALDSVERMFTADDLRAFYAKEAEHEKHNQFIKGAWLAAAGILVMWGFFVGLALCWYYGPQLYVEAQHLREFFGSVF